MKYSPAHQQLSTLFSPRSIALVGASKHPETVGGTLLKNLIGGGFKKPLFLVNPKYERIEKFPCYPNLSDIPTRQVDLIIIATPAKTVPSILEQAVRKKVTAGIIISAGFAEEGGKGKKLEQQIQSIVKKNKIRLLGPNCLGLMNTDSKLNASFAADMPKAGPIGFLSQSGAFCTAILDWAQQRSLGFSSIISVGNEADLNETDFIEYLAGDKQTKVISGYVKSIGNLKRFLNAAKSITPTKPIILLKGGPKKEVEIKRAFRKAGIVHAKTSRELFQLSLTFAEAPLPKGPRVAIVSNGGGPVTIAVDEIKKRRLKLAQKPIDLIGDAPPERYRMALDLVSRDRNIDMLIVFLTHQRMTDPDKVADIIVQAKKKFKKPLLVSFMGGDDVLPALKNLQKHHIPTFSFPEEAIKTAAALYHASKPR
ncbi:MAG: CoA-binding protein [bacterium]|nr:CoA-binding protein [bacterium]